MNLFKKFTVLMTMLCILLTATVFSISSAAAAQNRTWNMSEHGKSGNITADFVWNDLSVKATASKYASFDGNYMITQGSANVISFDVEGPCTISVTAKSNNASKARYAVVSDSKGKQIGTDISAGKSDNTGSVDYSGSKGIINITPKGGGISIRTIKVEYGTSGNIKGDINGDGKVDSIDAVLLFRHLVNKNIITDDIKLSAADCNDDGKINIADVVWILNYNREESTEITTQKTEATTKSEIKTEATTKFEGSTETTTINISDGVVVSNFSDLKKEIAKKNNKIYVKGKISCTSNIKLSTSNANTEIYGLTNADGTAASLDFAAYRDGLSKSGSGGTGLTISGSHYTFKNIIIENAGDCGIRIAGSSSGYCTFENCIFRYNNNSGISITKGGSHNTFRCVDSYRNGDVIQKNGADADGFSVKLTAGTENNFYNCRAWENSDDGWDSYDRGTPYVGNIQYIECLTWNNGNPYVFTGEYDYNHGFPLDKNLIYVQAILRQDPDFESKYNSHSVTSWPKLTVQLLGTSNNYDNIHSSSWRGNPNGFKFGSAETPSSSYRYIKNCIAFDHENTPNQKPAKGFDQNNGSASYDIINALSFNNGQNYQMVKMKAKSMSGVFYSFNSGQADDPGDLNLTTPDASKQAELQNKVYAYRDMIYSYVYNDKIPGEQICNVF